MTTRAVRAAIVFALVAGTTAAVSGDAESVSLMQPAYTDLVYPEGTVYDGADLMFTDMKLGAVYRIVGGAPVRIWSDSRCGPTSLAKLPSGQWLLACHLSHELVFLDLTNPTAPTVVARKPFRRPNDVYPWNLGVYVSRSGEFSPRAPVAGEVWLVRGPDDMRRVASGIHYANGVAVTRDNRFLLVGEHFERRVWRYPILPDGNLGERVPALTLTASPNAPPYEGPDGIEPAPDGGFYVAIYGAGYISHVGANGAVTESFFTAPYAKVTNLALTPDGKGFYAVASSLDETKGALFQFTFRQPTGPAHE